MARTIPSRTRTSGSGRPSAGRAAEGPAKAVPLHGPDGLLLFALAGLLSVGMIMVYSATAPTGGFDVLRKMGIQFGFGAAGLMVGLLLPLSTWRRMTPLAVIACILALASLLWEANPLALNSRGSTRWLVIGPLTVQPSEFAKLAFILYAAHFLENRGLKMGLFRGYKHWVAFLTVALLLLGLIAVEDLGTGLVLAGITFCLLWVAEVDLKALGVGLVLAALAVTALIRAEEYRGDRLKAWLNPWAYHRAEGHQVIQSWTAIARGGLTGVGLGQSLQKLDNRLPEAETDFIFAVIAEELGFFRAAGVILLFLLFAWRGYAIAARAPDRYTGLLAAGITSWISVQAGINLGVVTGTIPNTGVPLPFISSGGSSLLAVLMAVGILIGISRRTVAEKERIG